MPKGVDVHARCLSQSPAHAEIAVQHFYSQEPVVIDNSGGAVLDFEACPVEMHSAFEEGSGAGAIISHREEEKDTGKDGKRLRF